MKRSKHLLLHADHPLLHGALGLAGRLEVIGFPLRRYHTNHRLVPAAKFELGAVIVQLEHVFLDGRWIRCAEDGKKLVVGDEEEARERVPLDVEVVRE